MRNSFKSIADDEVRGPTSDKTTKSLIRGIRCLVCGIPRLQVEPNCQFAIFIYSIYIYILYLGTVLTDRLTDLFFPHDRTLTKHSFVCRLTKEHEHLGVTHISIFPILASKMTLSGGWVNCCDANFVMFFYRFFRRSITHNNISLRTKKVILDSLPQHSTPVR